MAQADPPTDTGTAIQTEVAPPTPLANPRNPHMLELMRRLETCRDLPVCNQPNSSQAAVAPYRDNPCTLSPQERQELSEWLLRLRAQGAWGFRGWALHNVGNMVGILGLLVLLGTVVRMMTGEARQTGFPYEVLAAIIGVTMAISGEGYSANSRYLGGSLPLPPREALRLIDDPMSHHSWFRRTWRRAIAVHAQTVRLATRTVNRMEQASEARRLERVERMRNAVLLPHQRGLPAPQVNPELPTGATERIRVVVEPDATSPTGVRVCVPGETADAAADLLAEETQVAEEAGEFATRPTPDRENSGNGSGEVSRSATTPGSATNSSVVLHPTHRRRRVVLDGRRPHDGALSNEVNFSREVLSGAPAVLPGAGAPTAAGTAETFLPAVAP